MDENLEEEKVPETSESETETETPIIPSGPDPDAESEPEFQQQTYPSLGNRKKGPKKLIFLFLAVVVALLVLFNAVKFVASKFQKATPTPTPVEVATESPSPTPQESTSPLPSDTPKPSTKPTSSIDSATGLDRSKLSVTVENGSGEAGVGAKGSTFLKNLGYDVISTGNADNFNFTNVTIQVKASQKAYLPLLNKDLSTSYSVGSTSADLTATSSADALVIIGK